MLHEKGTYRQIDRQTDIATTRKNRPKGRFFDNVVQRVNGWVAKNVKEFETGRAVLEDTLVDDIELSHANSEKYLGQIITSDSKNTKNI